MAIQKKLENWFYFWAGLVFLTLAKIKHSLFGYITPKPFSMAEVDRCVDYDVGVVNGWLNELNRYASSSVSGMNVLELGPGSDLGIGLLLLAHGAKNYTAFDVNNLAASSDASFYERLFSRFEIDMKIDTNQLRQDYLTQLKTNDGRLQYVHRKNFDLLDAMKGKSFNLVFSQAAFEHFDDVKKTIADLSKICANDAVAVILVDLKTHSRWIRDKDPNNIYRYPDWLYRLFYFPGIPNRVRPSLYQSMFARYGWVDIEVRPLTAIADSRVIADGPHMAKPFRDTKDMSALTVLLCARRSMRPK